MTIPSSPLILRVPHLQQPAAGECLPVCAAMVLTYLGMRVNYRQLVRLLQTQVGYGTPFSNIRALTKLKVTVTYRQGQLDDIRRFLQAGAPVLVPVQTRELPHWDEDTPHAVVVVGMDAQTIYINDPAFLMRPLPFRMATLTWPG